MFGFRGVRTGVHKLILKGPGRDNPSDVAGTVGLGVFWNVTDHFAAEATSLWIRAETDQIRNIFILLHP